MRQPHAWIAGVLSLLIATPPLAAPGVVEADEDTIRCESKNYRYRYCRIDTDNRVRLERELSRSRCRDWRSWGYDKRGVWVDDGCRAEFRVGKDGGISGGTAAAIGAVAGVGVLAAILASKNKSNDHGNENGKEAPESWAIGRFRGYDPAFDSLMEITVSSDGTVRGEAGSERVEGRMTKDHLHIGPNVFDVDRIDGGFKATRSDDKHNVVYYHKAD